jgi:hypothetical protein
VDGPPAPPISRCAWTSWATRSTCPSRLHDRSAIVTHCGRICFNRRKINLSPVFAGQKVGIKEVTDRIWLATFVDYDLGYFDRDQDRVEPGLNPFAPDTVLTRCPE